MGASVSLSPLTITIRNQSSEQVISPAIQQARKALCFPFYILKQKASNTIAYKTEQEIEIQKIEDEVLYKCTLQGFSSLTFQNMNANPSYRMWREISEIESAKIGVSDQIKVGNFHIIFKYLVLDKKQSSLKVSLAKNTSVSDSKIVKQDDNNHDISSLKCRICFQHEDYKRNPLISLCGCGGSVKYTHFDCLKQWVKSRILELQYPNCTIYNFSPLFCQLCKKRIQPYFQIDQQIYSLIETKKIDPPYLIFQSKCSKSQRITIIKSKLIEGLTLTMGRSEQCDIPVKQSMVSRKHCLLFYTHRQLFIKDLKSKYGTFLYSKNAIFSRNIENGMILGVGNSKIEIGTEKQYWLNCCKGFENIQVKVIDEADDKFTVETNWDLLDFLQ